MVSELRPRAASAGEDDFVILFHLQADAERVMEVLPKRFGKYRLALHPDKTPARHPRGLSTKRPETRVRTMPDMTPVSDPEASEVARGM